MDPIVKACAECTQTCCLIHGKNKSIAVTSFFKVMIGELFSKVLFLPPKFACSALVQDGQSAILEDSSGQIWEVNFQKSNDNLVFQQGWSTFASDHNLQVGEFVLFFLTKQWHFVVKIFDRTSCEKLDFSGQTKKKRKRKAERGSDSDAAVETNRYVPAQKQEDPGDEMEFMVGRRGSDEAEAEREVNRIFNFDEWMNESADDVACVQRPSIGLGDYDDDVCEVAKEASSGGFSEKGSSSFAAISTLLLATNVVNPEEINEETVMKSAEIVEALFDEGSKENVPGSEIKGCLVGEGDDRILPSHGRDLDEENQQCTEKVVNGISGTSNTLEDSQFENDRILPSPDRDLDNENQQCPEKLVNGISGTFDIPKNCQPDGENQQCTKEMVNVITRTSGDDQILPSRGCDLDNENKNCSKIVVNEVLETCDKPENCQYGNDHILPSDNEYQKCIEKVVNGISGTPNVSENCQSVKGDEDNSGDENKKCTEVYVNSISRTFNTPIKLVVKKEIVIKDPVESKFYSNSCKTTPKLGESSKIAKRSVDNRVLPVVVKTEIVDSDKNYAMTPTKFRPMLATCAHRDFIELPDILPFPTIKGRANFEKKVVYIRDSAMKIWPVLYHEKQATQFLKSGLDDLIEANRIKSGAQCLFTSEDEAQGIYSLSVL